MKLGRDCWLIGRCLVEATMPDIPRRLRAWGAALALAAPLAAASTAAWAQADFSGKWRTNQGAMRIDQDGERVTGEYELKDGQVRGHVHGDTLTGTWAQSSANHRCFEARMGTYYWGRFWMRMSPDGDSFRGRWSYCEDEPGSGGDWTGGR
jgi:hypothetical protein